jgi:hypothetical protein
MMGADNSITFISPYTDHIFNKTGNPHPQLRVEEDNSGVFLYKGPAPADRVAEWMASLVKRDAGLTKMCLALIQAATAARSVGTYVVRCVEAAEVKRHIEKMQARQQFYLSGQSNQEGGAALRRDPLEIMPYRPPTRISANPSLEEILTGGGSGSVVSDS